MFITSSFSLRSRLVNDKSFSRLFPCTNVFPFSVLMIFFSSLLLFWKRSTEHRQQTRHGRGNNNDCRIVKGRGRKSSVGKWEDKPLIRVETHKKFSSVCIHSEACHYVFVTLLSSPRSLRVRVWGLKMMNKFSPIVTMNTERKIFPPRGNIETWSFLFNFQLKRKSCVEEGKFSLKEKKNSFWLKKLSSEGEENCFLLCEKRISWNYKMGEKKDVKDFKWNFHVADR